MGLVEYRFSGVAVRLESHQLGGKIGFVAALHVFCVRGGAEAWLVGYLNFLVAKLTVEILFRLEMQVRV